MKKNIKTIIGLMIAFVIGISTTVTAATIFRSEDITYSSDKTDKTNVKDSLDELYSKVGTGGECPEGKICLEDNFINKVKIGDYISMTPTSTSYTISKSLTGYTSDQTINPSELNLWRVIKKNENGTVDMVSHYASSSTICFKGVSGLTNYESVLQEISGQYVDSTFTSGARYVGYSSLSLSCTSASSCSNTYGWYRDLGLMNGFTVLILKDNPALYSAKYWLGGRYWYSSSVYGGHAYNWVRGGSSDVTDVNFRSTAECAFLRIIVTLKDSVSIKSGSGTESSPYILS